MAPVVWTANPDFKVDSERIAKGTELFPCREFAKFEEFGRLPDKSNILKFRHRLEKHKVAEQILSAFNELFTHSGLLLKAGTAVDATPIFAPTSTKNKDKARYPKMFFSKKERQ